MNRRFSKAALTGCMALAPFLFPAASVAASPKVVALQATIAITEEIAQATAEDPHCTLIGAISGTGTAGSLGPVTVTSRDCINPVNATATTFIFASDELVLTTAGGDQIWAAYGGTLSATTGQIQGTYLIFGGTGRFKRAKGVGTINGLEDLGAGAGQIELKGTLAY